jgi:hypothetical protein
MPGNPRGPWRRRRSATTSGRRTTPAALCERFPGHPEDTLDAALVSHDDLDVGLLVKTCAWIDRFALGKHALHRVYRRLALDLEDTVQTANHRAIQVPPKPVCAVCGQAEGASGDDLCQAVVCPLHPFDSGGSGEVEAQPKLDDRADYKRFSDLGRLPLSGFSREIQTPLWIRLPEIDPWAQPIIVVVARAERVTLEKPLSNPSVAAVIAENEC